MLLTIIHVHLEIYISSAVAYRGQAPSMEHIPLFAHPGRTVYPNRSPFLRSLLR